MIGRLKELYLHNWRATVGVIAAVWGAAGLYLRHEFSEFFNSMDALRLLTVSLVVMLGMPLIFIAIEAVWRRRA
jgi:hypothetical protein